MGRHLAREKRILLLMREYVLGGAETQFRYLIEYAESHQWKLDVVIEHDLKKVDGTLKNAAEKAVNVRFYELHGDRMQVLAYIIKNIFRVRYRAVLIYYPFQLALAPLIHMLGISVVYSERVDASGIAGNPYFRRYLKSCSHITANSKYAQRELEKLTGRKVMLVRNGKPAVAMFPLKENRQITRILVPARIAPPKNQMLPLNYLKCCPDFSGKIVFAGMAEDKAYYGKLKQFVRKYGLQDKVEFLGYVNEMAQEYRKADLILLPSFAEGTPNVVLEAYAYGRPVIVSDINVERDIVPDSRLRFSVNDPAGIGECIQYVQEMPDQTYRQLIKENRKFVLQNYSIEKMAESFYRILSK